MESQVEDRIVICELCGYPEYLGECHYCMTINLVVEDAMRNIVENVRQIDECHLG